MIIVPPNWAFDARTLAVRAALACGLVLMFVQVAAAQVYQQSQFADQRPVRRQRPATTLAAYAQPQQMLEEVPPGDLSNAPTPPPMLRGMPSPASEYPGEALPHGPQDDHGNFIDCDCAECQGAYSGHVGHHGFFSHKAAPPQSDVPALYQPGKYPRALGYGDPLAGTSWLNRPFHVDFFIGGMIGDDAINDQVSQESGFFTGGRIGWDYDHYWGVESRLGIAWMSLVNGQDTNDIGTGNIVLFDMSLLYYPWGDSRWRPYLTLGTGIAQFDTYGSQPASYSGTLWSLPFGGGLKYRFSEWLTWRFDVIDNLAFADGGLETMHNVSFTAGVEYHFGGRRRSYWPWNPNPRH